MAGGDDGRGEDLAIEDERDLEGRREVLPDLFDIALTFKLPLWMPCDPTNCTSPEGEAASKHASSSSESDTTIMLSFCLALRSNSNSA